MYCKNCGIKIDDDSKYCQGCGTKLYKELEKAPHSPIPSSEAIINKKTLSENENEIQSFLPAKEVNSDLKVIEKLDSVPLDTEPILSNQDRPPIYDPSYTKETEAVIVAILVGVIIFGISRTQGNDYESQRDLNTVLLRTFPFILTRIIGPIWVVNIVKRQNREPIIAGIFSVLFPLIALIVVGMQRKLYANPVINPKLSKEDNSKLLYNSALKFFKRKSYVECIRFCKKILEFDPSNKEAIDLLKVSTELISNKVDNNYQSEIIIKNTVGNQQLKILKNNLNINGSIVYLDDVLAPDGTYSYDGGGKKMITKDNKVESILYINEYKNIIVEQKSSIGITINDNVFFKDGSIPPDGKYKLSYAFGGFQVKDGRIFEV